MEDKCPIDPSSCGKLRDNPSSSPGTRPWFSSFSNLCLLTLVCVTGPLLFTLVVSIVGRLQNGYDPIRDTISRLVFGPYGWLQTTIFFIFALLLLLLAQRMYFAINKNLAVKIGIYLLVISAIGIVLVGLFPAEPPGVIQPTLTNALHGWIAHIIILIFPFVCLLLAVGMRIDPRWKPFYKYSIVTGVLGIILPLTGVALPDIDPWNGLYERIIALNAFVWLETISIRILLLCLHSKK